MLDQNISKNGIGTAIIAAAVKVRDSLGSRLLESTLERCLTREISKRALCARRQAMISLRYDNLLVENAWRIDLLVENLVVFKIKSVEALLPVHSAQLTSQLKRGGYRLRYLFNFNVTHMRDGIIRRVNGR